jgi:serine/threonine protein kinase
MEGGDLFSLVYDNGPLEEAETRRITTQVLDAIKYLHNIHIAHRDIKVFTLFSFLILILSFLFSSFFLLIFSYFLLFSLLFFLPGFAHSVAGEYRV